MRGCVRFAILTMGALLVGVLSVNCWAEFRTWTAASGSYRTEAEFVELRDEGKVVHLRLKAGGERDVPLEKLSAADQDFVKAQIAMTSASSAPTSSDARIADLQRRAGRCPSAEEALRLYRLFRDDPQTTDDQRRAILGEFEKLLPLADKKMMRKGGQWVSESEFKSVRAQANSLMKQGLELLRLKQEDGFRKKFAEAAAVEPDSIRADFLMGMLYTIHTNDLLKTKKYFEACLKRDPDNVCVLNNLALTSVKRNEAQNAVNYWQKAVALEPNQGIVQNLGRLLDLAGRKRLEVPKSATAKVSEMYASLIGTEKYDGADAKRGWMYMLIDEESLSLTVRDPEKEKQQETSATAAPPPGEDGSVVVGGGTGFVIFPKYVLTNNHVVHGAASIEIQTSGSTAKQTLPAKVIATSEKPDLALIYCEGLDAPPLPLDPELSRRGTEIMALGYPKMFDLGASLKATRGIISAVPSSAQEDMYLYDATINPGNSGGPVFDNHGNVLAVTTVLWKFESQYGGGLPSPVALEFIKKHLPLFATPLATETLDWQSVDQKVSPSTVLVWSRSKDPKATAAVAWSGYREDRDCLACGGMGILRCGCRDGVVTVRQGRSTVPAKCPQCDGKRLLKCGACKGTGIDPDLVRTATKRAETSPSPPRNDPGANDPDSSGPTPNSTASPEQMRDWQQAYARQRGASVEQQNSIGMRLTLIPPGEFQMGSSAHDINSRKKIAERLDLKPPNEALTDTPEETPRHLVTVSKPFLLGAAEVTTGQFRQFVSAEKFETDAERTGATRFDFAQRKWLPNDAGTNWRTPGFDGQITDDCPVTAVSWNDAAAFCNWLSAKEDLTACYRSEGGSWALNCSANGYRLPTEAEWEYACRAGTTSFLSAGNQPKEVEPYVWCFPNAPRAPQPVGTKRPNGFGLYDMHGNVAEWCQDRYAADYYGRSPRKDPAGPESGGERVARGGDWYSMALFCRSAKRVHFPPASAMNTRGFRVARTF